MDTASEPLASESVRELMPNDDCHQGKPGQHQRSRLKNSWKTAMNFLPTQKHNAHRRKNGKGRKPGKRFGKYELQSWNHASKESIGIENPETKGKDIAA